MSNVFLVLVAGILLCDPAMASELASEKLDLTRSWAGYLSLAGFIIAYLLVVLEEKIHLRKSKPMLAAAGLVWLLVAIVYNQHGMPHMVAAGIRHDFLEYAELFFFLLVAMTYINSMLERGVFDELRHWLVSRGFGYRALFWITGILSFFLSPIADNLTTALIMCAVVMAVGRDETRFIGVACTNIVVAANAGGAFSPFGDITTLMVWQKGILEVPEFLTLFVPSVVNYLIPAFFMQFAIPPGKPPSASDEGGRRLMYGGVQMAMLFLFTIVTVVVLHNVLHVPPAYGMMGGLLYLKLYGYYMSLKSRAWWRSYDEPPGEGDDPYDFDVFSKIGQAEWDTLFFFYGVILTVGGLGFIGYLGIVSEAMYGQLGYTGANILVGVLSALVDNIPVMFAVLTMNPPMDNVQWLLVTLTAGVGGSLLSIGSAAGVALMGQARGYYTFFSHLKWTPVIALGYGASIWVHLLINT
ncbi:MAG: sodium:proton antiporter NhaD [Halioglobus sp.]|nr:sodium:proton antiporter NhaD [Halioglobus sp.]